MGAVARFGCQRSGERLLIEKLFLGLRVVGTFPAIAAVVAPDGLFFAVAADCYDDWAFVAEELAAGNGHHFVQGDSGFSGHNLLKKSLASTAEIVDTALGQPVQGGKSYEQRSNKSARCHLCSRNLNSREEKHK